ncbi:MAG: hypothetical protein SangKO_031930 [Sandaracinaceae bacterium]
MTTKRTTPMEDLELLGSFTGTESAPNKTIRFEWENVDPEIGGFAKLALGLWLNITLTYDAVALTMPAAMQGERLWDFIQSVLFKVDEHVLIDNISGLGLFHDIRRCCGAPTTDAPADVADGDASGTQVQFTIYLPFTPHNLAPGAELDGAIPVAALRREDLSIKLSGGDLGGFPGVTWTASTIEARVHWRAHHKLIIPTHWGILRNVRKETEYTLKPRAGYLYYLDVFNKAENNGWDFDHADYGSIEVAVGNGRLEQWPDTTVASALHNLRAQRQDLGADQLVVSAPEFLPLIPEVRGGLASKQPMGPIRIKHASPGNHDESELVYRTRGTRHDGWRATMMRRLGVAGPVGNGLVKARGGSVPEVLHPHLPEHVVWPGMPYPSIVALNRPKFRILQG